MRFEALKVGELARRTGLTVRTLHHYDAIGLLRPSLHTAAGHRLYTAGDIAPLQQIVSLRQLGFSLEEVRDCLDRPDFSPLEVIRLHVARLREQIELKRKLCEGLEALAEHFRPAGEVSAEAFLQAIEVMHMIENYYTPEQIESFRKRGEEAAAAGQDLARQGTADWNALLAQYKAEMEKGTDPADPRLQELEQRRRALVSAFSGGDAAIEQNLKRLWTEQGDKSYRTKLRRCAGPLARSVSEGTACNPPRSRFGLGSSVLSGSSKLCAQYGIDPKSYRTKLRRCAGPLARSVSEGTACNPPRSRFGLGSSVLSGSSKVMEYLGKVAEAGKKE